MISRIEPLESRRLLASDLTVAIAATTLPDSLLAGVAAKPAVATVNVSITGDAPAKTNKGSVTVNVSLRQGETLTSLGTAQVKASALKAGKPAKAAVKLNVPTSLPEGTYTLVASVDAGATLEESDIANNTASGKTVVASPATADIAVSTTTPLSGTVANATTSKVTIVLTNNGNVDAKGTAVLDLISTAPGREDATRVTIPNLKFNLKPGKTLVLKNLPYDSFNNTESAITESVTARFTPSTTLIRDVIENNTTSLGSLNINPVPPSPFGQLAGNIISFRTNQSFKTPAFAGFRPATREEGTWADKLGNSGTFSYTTGGNENSDGLMSLRNSAGTPVISLKFASLTAGKSAPTMGKVTLLFGGPATFATAIFAGNTLNVSKSK